MPSGPAGDSAAVSRFSLLSEAAAAPAEVRLADSSGTVVWACLAHADEVLVTVPGAFVASDEGTGIASFLALRHG
jgi:hypothetical protein